MAVSAIENLMRSFARARSALSAAATSGAGVALNEAQLRFVLAVDRLGPSAAGVIADEASLLKPSCSRIIRDLLASDLITVEKGEKNRTKLIKLTPSGRAIVRAARKHMSKLDAAYAAALPSVTLEALERDALAAARVLGALK